MNTGICRQGAFRHESSCQHAQQLTTCRGSFCVTAPLLQRCHTVPHLPHASCLLLLDSTEGQPCNGCWWLDPDCAKVAKAPESLQAAAAPIQTTQPAERPQREGGTGRRVQIEWGSLAEQLYKGRYLTPSCWHTPCQTSTYADYPPLKTTQEQPDLLVNHQLCRSSLTCW